MKGGSEEEREEGKTHVSAGRSSSGKGLSSFFFSAAPFVLFFGEPDLPFPAPPGVEVFCFDEPDSGVAGALRFFGVE